MKRPLSRRDVLYLPGHDPRATGWLRPWEIQSRNEREDLEDETNFLPPDVATKSRKSRAGSPDSYSPAILPSRRTMKTCRVRELTVSRRKWQSKPQFLQPREKCWTVKMKCAPFPLISHNVRRDTLLYEDVADLSDDEPAFLIILHRGTQRSSNLTIALRAKLQLPRSCAAECVILVRGQRVLI